MEKLLHCGIGKERFGVTITFVGHNHPTSKSNVKPPPQLKDKPKAASVSLV